VTAPTKKIDVVLVDNEAFARNGLKALIDAQPDMRVAAETADGRAALERVCEGGVNIVVAEAALPGLGAAELLGELRRRDLAVGVIVLTHPGASDDALRLIQAGAAGYLLKSTPPAELLDAVRTVHAGGRVLEPHALNAVLSDYTARCGPAPVDRCQALTAREREVLTMVAEGLSTREIAEQLSLSHKTVEVHRRRIMCKLGLHKVADLVRYAVREGLVSIDLV